MLKRLDLVFPWKGRRAVNLLMSSGKIHTDALLFGADKHVTVMLDEDGAEYGFWCQREPIKADKGRSRMPLTFTVCSKQTMCVLGPNPTLIFLTSTTGLLV